VRGPSGVREQVIVRLPGIVLCAGPFRVRGIAT
jgi:hypothetical protein